MKTPASVEKIRSLLSKLSFEDVVEVKKIVTERHLDIKSGLEHNKKSDFFKQMELNLLEDSKIIRKIVTNVVNLGLKRGDLIKDERMGCDSRRDSPRDSHRSNVCWHIEKCSYGQPLPGHSRSETCDCAYHAADSLLRFGSCCKYIDGVVIPGGVERYTEIAFGIAKDSKLLS